MVAFNENGIRIDSFADVRAGDYAITVDGNRFRVTGRSVEPGTLPYLTVNLGVLSTFERTAKLYESGFDHAERVTLPVTPGLYRSRRGTTLSYDGTTWTRVGSDDHHGRPRVMDPVEVRDLMPLRRIGE